MNPQLLICRGHLQRVWLQPGNAFASSKPWRCRIIHTLQSPVASQLCFESRFAGSIFISEHLCLMATQLGSCEQSFLAFIRYLHAKRMQLLSGTDRQRGFGSNQKFHETCDGLIPWKLEC
jgi:hypothetical protein